jgi:carbon monoxide dehydrogenase subunit G
MALGGHTGQMARFAATNRSEADVDATPAAVWGVLTDPAALVRLTPLLTGIRTDGDTWVWQMQRIKALGVGIDPVFTEAMTFQESGGKRTIRYHHAPPHGADERVGAEGTYVVTGREGATHLAIELTVSVELPLPTISGPAVRSVMSQLMTRTGDRFATNLLREVQGR